MEGWWVVSARVQVQEVRAQGKARATPVRVVMDNQAQPQRVWITARGD